MRKILFYSTILFLNSVNFAQNLQKPSPVEISSLPLWAKTMYSENPSIFEVDKLYKEFYRNNPFEKSFHTQYYKRWRRKYLNYADENGFIHEPSPTETHHNDQIYRGKQTNAKSSDWSIVGPITNYQEGGTQGSGQTNVYSVDQCLNAPTFMYCGTEPGEVYKSIDEGLNWDLVSKNENFGSGVTAIEVHPSNPDIVFAGGNNGVLRSTDGGQIWINVLPNTNFGVNEILIHPTNDQLIFACTDKGLYRSLDGGTTWNLLFSNKTYDIKSNTADGSILYIVRNNPTAVICEFLKTTDYGESWNVQSNGWYSSTDAARSDGGARLAVTEANPDRIYAYLIGESKPNDFGYIGVYRSDDGGSSWILPNGPTGGPYTTDHVNLAIGWADWTYHQGFYNCALMASPSNPDEILVGGLNLYKSINGGSSFTPVAGYVGGPLGMHVDMQDFRILGNTAWVSTDGGIYRSTDFFSSNYEFRMSGVHGSDYWGLGGGWNEDVLVGGLYHNGNLAYYENYGAGNFLELGGGEAPTGYVNPGVNRNTYFSDIQGKIIPINLNAPISNLPFGMAPNESYWAAESSEMEFHPNCYSTAYIGKDNSICRTTDAGASFHLLNTFGTNTANQVKYIEVSSRNPEVIYLNQQPASGSTGILWKTSDGGLTWTEINKPSGNSRRMLLSLNPENENELWLAYPNGANGFKVFKTTNSGQSWINLTSSILNNESVQAITTIAGTDGGIYVATNRAIYYRNNQSSFQLDNSGLPLYTNGNILKPFYRDGKIRLASYGKGIWESNFSEAPTYPIARAMVDKLNQEVICEIDSFYFEDHSFLNHTNASWAWSFPTGSPNVSNLRNPAVLFTQLGSHLAILQITDGNGNIDLDTIQVNLNFLNLPSAVSEGFEGSFLPSGWSISNPNNDAQWSLSSSAGAYGNSSKSAIFDNYYNDSQGNSDDLIMNFNPSQISSNSFLSFDVAYARWGGGYSDTLEVLASTDCGSTYQSLYLKGGTDLATSPDYQNYFTPSPSQWRTDSIDLANYSNESNLQIAFRNIGRYGNVVYLDNINIGNTLTIDENEILSPLIYPNPIKNGETLSIAVKGEYLVLIIDLKGSVVQREFGRNLYSFKLSNRVSQGIYSVQIQTTTKIWNKPIFVTK